MKYKLLHDKAWMEARAHLSGQAVAKEIGSGDNAVYKARLKFGIPNPGHRGLRRPYGHHPRNTPLADRAWMDARKDNSAEDIARELGCSDTTVRRAQISLGMRIERKLPRYPILRDKAWMNFHKTWSAQDVAKEAQSSLGAVYGARRRLKLSNRLKLLHNRVWMTKRIVAGGQTHADIARELGCTEKLVSRSWKDMWKIRSKQWT